LEAAVFGRSEPGLALEGGPREWEPVSSAMVGTVLTQFIALIGGTTARIFLRTSHGEPQWCCNARVLHRRAMRGEISASMLLQRIATRRNRAGFGESLVRGLSLSSDSWITYEWIEHQLCAQPGVQVPLDGPRYGRRMHVPAGPYRLIGASLIAHACHCHWCQRETRTTHALNALYAADRVRR
jgi:hypothetical protein